MKKINILENTLSGKRHIFKNNKVLCGYKPSDYEKPQNLEINYVTCESCKRIYGITG